MKINYQKVKKYCINKFLTLGVITSSVFFMTNNIKAAEVTTQRQTKAQFQQSQSLQNNNGIKVRIKDVSRLQGEETYELTGYGIVTGLMGTGDSDNTLIQRTMSNLLKNFNIYVEEKDLKLQNSAAVMVSVKISGSHSKGDFVTATVSAIGDSESLYGGVLMMTPLLGPDAKVWGIAQGSLTIGGYTYGSSEPGGERQTKNVPSSGVVNNGVKLVRDIGLDLTKQDELVYVLHDPDYTSAVNVAKSINKAFPGVALAKNAAQVTVKVPKKFHDENNIMGFISEIDQMYFTADSIAKIVFNERTGTLVIGENVKISHAAISHGNLFITVKSTLGVSQPNAFGQGDTAVIQDQKTDVQEIEGQLVEMKKSTTVKEIVDGLNALGVSARDIMVIFHGLKAAGALHATIEAI